MIRFAFSAMALLLCASMVQASEPLLSSFDVRFDSAVETIGVDLVPTVSVLPKIPAGFTPVGIGDPVTPIVVRTARCNVTIFGQTLQRRKIVQVGAVIIPPDGTGDINNYTLYYYTDDIRLALLLNLVGVQAQYVPTLQYKVGQSGEFTLKAPLPAVPQLNIGGTVFPSSQPAGSFIANWWQQSAWTTVKMQTTVPVIKIGGADLELTTPPSSSLANIVGGTVLTFPLLQQFNQFESAVMVITPSL